MTDQIVIARAEVISIERANLVPPPTVSNPFGGEKPVEIVVSKLQITPVSDEAKLGAMHGTIHVPMKLEFGKVFELVLRDPVYQPALTENARMFKDE